MDPLRPFATLLRSLLKIDKSPTARRTGSSGRASQASTSEGRLAPTVATAPVESIHSRLQVRLSSPVDWNSDRAREQFIECILLAELGDDLQRDPAFHELVKRVSSQLSEEPRISARLDDVLKEIVRR